MIDDTVTSISVVGRCYSDQRQVFFYRLRDRLRRCCVDATDRRLCGCRPELPVLEKTIVPIVSPRPPVAEMAVIPSILGMPKLFRYDQSTPPRPAPSNPLLFRWRAAPCSISPPRGALSREKVVVLMINFTFAALTLGFASAGTYVPRTRAVLASIWHEALPMLVYSQVLIWGQSCMALLTVGFLRMGNPDISPFLGALVTMGLETGRDVMSFSSTEIAGEWAEEVRHQANLLCFSSFGVWCVRHWVVVLRLSVVILSSL